MDSHVKPSPSEAHPETMDFLSSAWCNFAVQAIQSPELNDHRSIILLNDQAKKFDCDPKDPLLKLDTYNVKVDDVDSKFVPPWRSNDMKSWIWMQQAMHPELNYNSCFRKKWFSWTIVPLKSISIKKWLQEIKQKRKEEQRLQRAQVHAAISVAGVAAALASIAAENSNKDHDHSLNTTGTKAAAVASAAALVAVQCAQVAEAMGAKKEELRSAIGSAMCGTSASDILTLTAAAATSIKGAATLKARTGCKNILNGSVPVLPIEDNSTISSNNKVHEDDFDFDFEKCRSILENGSQFHVETPDGNFKVRSVSIILNNKAKVILKLRKLNILKSKQESVVLDIHAELYKDAEEDNNDDTHTCYLIVLSTNRGLIKLDVGDDYYRYKTWATTINQMLMLSTSCRNFELHYYKN